MTKEISIKLRNVEGYPSPSQEVREIMMIKLKAFFMKELEADLEPWRDLAACLWFALQNTDFFNEEKVLIKIKETEENRKNVKSFVSENFVAYFHEIFVLILQVLYLIGKCLILVTDQKGQCIKTA